MTIATHPAVAADEIPAPPAVPAPLPRLADAASQRGNIASSDREPGQQYAGRIPHGG